MTFILVLNILLISDFCQSFKPNFYNGRYFTREIKPTSSTFTSITETSSQIPVRESNHYHNSNRTSRNMQRIDSKRQSTTLKPSTHRENKQDNVSRLETQFFPHTRPYTAGSISDILNRFGSTPVLPNNFGSYQSRIEFERPIMTTIETATAASLQGDTFHPNRRQPNSEGSSSSRREVTPAAGSLVHAASLNTKVLHRPQNETGAKDEPLLITLPLFQYEQTIVHDNEPFIRKQRNLNENVSDFDQKLTENEKSGGYNETQHAGLPFDADPNADKDEAMVATKTSREHPLDRHEMRYFHDIFLNYPEPHHANYGHVQFTPELFEKRFESSKEGNRYKGEIVWKDNKGGYAQHHWDMALGKL